MADDEQQQPPPPTDPALALFEPFGRLDFDSIYHEWMGLESMPNPITPKADQSGAVNLGEGGELSASSQSKEEIKGVKRARTVGKGVTKVS